MTRHSERHAVILQNRLSLWFCLLLVQR